VYMLGFKGQYSKEGELVKIIDVLTEYFFEVL